MYTIIIKKKRKARIWNDDLIKIQANQDDQWLVSMSGIIALGSLIESRIRSQVAGPQGECKIKDVL